MNVEGYWHESFRPDSPYPMPVSDPLFDQWVERQSFLDALSRVESQLATVTQYRGWSNCRLCDCHNGSREFSFLNWKWPIGFRHYIEEHRVRPTQAFQDFIRACDEHLSSAASKNEKSP